jgi:hypothetical protein
MSAGDVGGRGQEMGDALRAPGSGDGSRDAGERNSPLRELRMWEVEVVSGPIWCLDEERTQVEYRPRTVHRVRLRPAGTPEAAPTRIPNVGRRGGIRDGLVPGRGANASRIPSPGQSLPAPAAAGGHAGGGPYANSECGRSRWYPGRSGAWTRSECKSNTVPGTEFTGSGCGRRARRRQPLREFRMWDIEVASGTGWRLG